MRKPKVYVFNYSGLMQSDLVEYFRKDDYEISVLKEHENSTIYCEQDKRCDYPLYCCDIMLIVEDDERRKGSKLIQKQLQLGCKLTHLNKAVITASSDREKLADLADQNITLFANPLDYIALGAWVRDCEKRMNLAQRLPVIRREVRHACNFSVQVRLPGEDADISAQAVDTSNCGMCLRTSRPMKQGQEIIIRSGRSNNAEVGIVRWVERIDEGWYHSGVTFCV
jgi:hypothetical protein